MKDEIAKGDIQLSQSGGKLRVDLVDKILFDSGEAVISKRGEGVLARVGAVLATMDDKQIQVSGHTDSNPISEKLAAQFPTNWELSVTRAVNVVRFLEEKANVPAEEPDRDRLRPAPPDRQQQERGRARAQPPHRDPADAVAGAQGDREVEAEGGRGGGAGPGGHQAGADCEGENGGAREVEDAGVREVEERAREVEAGEERRQEAPIVGRGGPSRWPGLPPGGPSP